VRCEAAELELSARLDGENDRRLDAAVAEHLETCASCRAFEEGARRIRVAARVRSASDVPDLVPQIMEAVRAPARLPRRPSGRPAWLPYAAAFVSGAVIAGLLFGGVPGLQRGPSPALATEIPEEVAAAATEIDSYRATFDIVEHNFHSRVPERRFTADIAFRAPERFRAQVVDGTAYPSEGWTRNDFVLAVDEDRWSIDAPRTCPRLALPSCAVVGRDVRSVVGRAPFDPETAMPTDIVLPIRTLVDVDRVEVVEETGALGRDAVVVSLTYHDATPLFAYLQAGGTWRPFFPHDRVLVTLDSETWFPLAYEVRAAASVERATWATRQSLPPEPAGALLFQAEARGLEDGPSAGWTPLRGQVSEARDHGFTDLGLAELAEAFGAEPPLPSYLRGLRLHRAGHVRSMYTVAYARGLSWLTISSVPGLDFGYSTSGGPPAVPLPLEGGVAQYIPATAEHARRLMVLAAGETHLLETNLPRDELVRIASSFPDLGDYRASPRQDLADARRALDRLLVLDPPPPGYRLWDVEARRGALTLRYLRPGSELDGAGIRIYQTSGAALPPPLDLEVLGVTVRGVPGRYSAERAELEWVEDGVYRSVQAPAFDLAGLLRIAETMEPSG
jgi:hypothetical protein